MQFGEVSKRFGADREISYQGLSVCCVLTVTAGMRVGEILSPTMYKQTARSLTFGNFDAYHLEILADLSDNMIYDVFEGDNQLDRQPLSRNNFIVSFSTTLQDWYTPSKLYGLFLLPEDEVEYIRRYGSDKPFEILHWDSFSITLYDSKVAKFGKESAVWGTRNQIKGCPVCVVEKLQAHWPQRWRAGEDFSSNTPLFAFHETEGENPKVKNLRPSDLTAFFATFGKLFDKKGVKTHSCRKGFFTICANSGVNMHKAHLLSRTRDGTAVKHYI